MPDLVGPQPATAEQVAHIYNGFYIMDNGQDRPIVFLIHTVRNGPLRGKRIVKRQVSPGHYMGFAFVTEDGGLGLWRRFREHRNEQYVQWATDLLAILRARDADPPGVDLFTASRISPDFNEFTIQRTRRCRRCNLELTSEASIESGIDSQCSNQGTAQARFRTTSGVEYNPPPRRRFAPTNVQLSMSELGTGELQ